MQGRADFSTSAAKQQRSLAPIGFDPASRAQIADCPAARSTARRNAGTSPRPAGGSGASPCVAIRPQRGEALLFGVERPGLRRDRLEQRRRRRQAQFGLVGPARSGRRFRRSRRAARVPAAGLLRQAARHRARRLQPAGQRHHLFRMRRAAGHVARRARRHSQSRACGGESVRLRRTKRGRCATSSTRAGAWRPVGRYDVGYLRPRRTRASPTSAPTARAASPSGSATTDDWIDRSGQARSVRLDDRRCALLAGRPVPRAGRASRPAAGATGSSRQRRSSVPPTHRRCTASRGCRRTRSTSWCRPARLRRLSAERRGHTPRWARPVIPDRHRHQCRPVGHVDRGGVHPQRCHQDR